MVLRARFASQPHPVDRHVGAMIRAKRKGLRLSQAELGEAIGTSFQQVQKYERGANRISASKLYEVAQYLKSPLATFFVGLEAPNADEATLDQVADFLCERGSHELMLAFQRMKPALRARLVGLAEAMAPPSADD